MTQILSSILHHNHDPISGNHYITALFHDGGHQVDKRQYKGPVLLSLLGEVQADLFQVSQAYDIYPEEGTCRRAGDPFEQPELPF